MKRVLVALAIGLLTLPTAALAQTTVEALQQQLHERDAEIARLRARIAALEKREAGAEAPAAGESNGPPSAETATGPAPAEAAEPVVADEGDRALERALVRQGGLLLPSGVAEIEPNVQYSHQSSNTNNFRRDGYGPALAGRVGLPWRSQVDVSVPYVFERRSSTTGSSRSDGIGDVALSLSHQFLDDTSDTPGLIGFAGYTFATGENTLFTNATSPVGHGAGFDSFDLGFTAVKRMDPLVYFGGYTFSHSFSGEQDGNSVDLGNSHTFRIGTLLAASPFTSLRAGFDLTFLDKTRFNGSAISGTDEPAATFELGTAVLVTRSGLLDVGVGAGLTRTAPDFRLTVAYPIRF